MGNTMKEKQECNESVLPFPHCCLLLREHCMSSTAWCQWPVPGADVLALSQMFWESRGAGSAWASLHHCTHPPPNTALQDPRVLLVCRNAGEQPHGDGFSAHSWVILINLATEEGAELNVLQTAWFWLQAQEIKWSNRQSLVYPI